jgi:hypothetical protein
MSMNFRKNVMGYKQLSIRGTVQINLRPSISSYKIDAQDIQIESHKSLDIYGQAMLGRVKLEVRHKPPN